MKRYWEQVEHAWSDRKVLLLQLMIELLARKLTLTELFLAYCHGDTDDITAVLYLALYRRAKRNHEVRKEHGKVAGSAAPQFQADPDQKPDDSQSGEDEDDEDADE